MNRVRASIQRVNESLVRVLQVILVMLFALLVVDVIVGVASRYIFGTQASWSEELARLLMVWLALLGAALVSRENKHLGLDIVVRSWPPEVRRLSELLVSVIVLSFAVYVMVWGGSQLVLQRFASGQTLPALAISKAWFYLALPCSGLLIALFAVEAFLRQLSDAAEPIEEVRQ